MCNLYAVTKGQQAIRELARAMHDTTGNLPPMPAVFPDYAAPVVRNQAEGERELTLMRWGFPPPPNLGTQQYADTKPKKTPVWFALDESRPLFAFAGIWRPWTGVRKKTEGEMEHRLFSFLTTEANAVVAPIHPKAMPGILTTQDEIHTWLTAHAEVA